MEIGVTLRNMGDQSDRQTLLRCARAAEERGFESAWVVDHIAIPPDDAEGSNGRYLDPLTTLAWLAGATSRIRLGTSVLILPYRPPLATAKAVATLQELSGERLLLGVGVGWMAPEFKALGIPRHERGRRTDATLAFLHQCFADDVMEANGQAFLFRPRPARPPILVGGSGPHALARVIAYGDAWLPMPAPLEELAAAKRALVDMAAKAGRPEPSLTLLGRVGRDVDAGARTLADYRELGAERTIASTRYDDAEDYLRWLDGLVAMRDRVN
ncbi:MAG: TIGR03619 family F420-dependent LLM class oxidoreductase [Gammaproteobacteria bacterium]|nr:TIGR03619 family F420-dependent LLM class oxidoreductase [Gammaproteobacteria bacterium]